MHRTLSLLPQALLLTLLVAVNACQSEPESKALHPDDFTAYSQELARWVSNGDLRTLEEAWSMSFFKARINEGLTWTLTNQLPAELLPQYVSNQLRRLAMPEDGTVTFLKMYREGNRFHAVFLYLSDSYDSFNLHEIQLINQGGKIYLGDIYNYLEAEFLSETFRRMQLMYSENGANQGSRYSIQQRDLHEMQRVLTQSDDAYTALARLTRLYSTLKDLRYYHVQRMSVAQNISDERFKAVCEDYLTEFPDGMEHTLFGIRYYGLIHDSVKYMQHYQYIDERTDGDPFVHSALLSHMPREFAPSTQISMYREAYRAHPQEYLAAIEYVMVLFGYEEFTEGSQQLGYLLEQGVMEWNDVFWDLPKEFKALPAYDSLKTLYQ